MRSLLMRWLLRWYMQKNREIHKLEEMKEYDCFFFKTPEDTLKLVRSLLTAQTLLYFEAKTQEERQMIKGAAFMLRFLRDGHNLAIHLKESDTDEILVREWRKFKIKGL